MTCAALPQGEVEGEEGGGEGQRVWGETSAVVVVVVVVAVAGGGIGRGRGGVGGLVGAPKGSGGAEGGAYAPVPSNSGARGVSNEKWDQADQFLDSRAYNRLGRVRSPWTTHRQGHMELPP